MGGGKPILNEPKLNMEGGVRRTQEKIPKQQQQKPPPKKNQPKKPVPVCFDYTTLLQNQNSSV